MPSTTSNSLGWHPQQQRDLTAASAGRRWARQALLGLLETPPDQELLDAVDLLVTELVTNAIRHGGGLVEARLTNVGDMVRLCVHDANPQLPVLRPQLANDQSAGRGMHLVEALSRCWGTTPCADGPGKCVWAEITSESAKRP